MSKIIRIDSCGECPYCHIDKHETKYNLYYCIKEKAIVLPETINSICKLEDHPIDKYWSDDDDMIIPVFDMNKLSKEERELMNKPVNLNGSIDYNNLYRRNNETFNQ